MSGTVDAGAPEDEIEVTPEMIEAGVNEFCAYDARFESAEDVVALIFRRMTAVAARQWAGRKT